MASVLVAAAHPDDEILGCGGTIAYHAEKGDDVHVLILAEGLTSRDGGRDASAQKEKLQELSEIALKANTHLGARTVKTLGLPDNRMDGMELLDIVKVVEAEIGAWNPEIVYTHHPGDVNVDHNLTARAVLTAARPQPGCCVRSIYFFEVLSSTDYQAPGVSSPFLPNRFVDVSAFLDRKLAALAFYAGEMRAWPHSRSPETVEHLARLRGSSVGMRAAEAFQVARILVP
jgi:N-acetylglucosamine malate deacetylase 1